VLFTIKNLERKVILVTDNASSFPIEKELHHGEVKVIFYHEVHLTLSTYGLRFHWNTEEK